MHFVVEAHARLFGGKARPFYFIDRPTVNAAFAECVREVRPGGFVVIGPGLDNMSPDLRVLAEARASLLALLGSEASMIISPVETDAVYARRAPLPGWRPRVRTVTTVPVAPAPVPAAPVHVPQPASGVHQRFGRFLLARGVITLPQLIAALRWQQQNRPSAGAIAVERGFITRAQLGTILRQQHKDELFGEAAVRLGYMTEVQRMAMLGFQRRRDNLIGAYLVAEGIVGRDELERLHAEFLLQRGLTRRR